MGNKQVRALTREGRRSELRDSPWLPSSTCVGTVALSGCSMRWKASQVLQPFFSQPLA